MRIFLVVVAALGLSACKKAEETPAFAPADLVGKSFYVDGELMWSASNYTGDLFACKQEEGQEIIVRFDSETQATVDILCDMVQDCMYDEGTRTDCSDVGVNMYLSCVTVAIDGFTEDATTAPPEGGAGGTSWVVNFNPSVTLDVTIDLNAWYDWRDNGYDLGTDEYFTTPEEFRVWGFASDGTSLNVSFNNGSSYTSAVLPAAPERPTTPPYECYVATAPDTGA